MTASGEELPGLTATATAVAKPKKVLPSTGVGKPVLFVIGLAFILISLVVLKQKKRKTD